MYVPDKPLLQLRVGFSSDATRETKLGASISSKVTLSQTLE